MDQPISTSLVEDAKFIGVDFALNVKQGVPATVDRIAVNDWARTADVDLLLDRGVELMLRHAWATYDGLMEEHTTFWAKVWNVMDI